jgi:hypothetical protein
MKARRLVLSIAVATMMVTGSAGGSEIYRWTDENGNVYYEDRPSGAATEQRLELTFRRTDSAAVTRRIQARLDRQAARNDANAAAEIEEQTAAESAAQAAERARACQRAQARLDSYIQSRRLYRTDDSGERVYLDDAQRQHARQQAEDQVAEFCS